VIEGVAVALTEKADQRRAATWLSEFAQPSDRRLSHLVQPYNRKAAPIKWSYKERFQSYQKLLWN